MEGKTTNRSINPRVGVKGIMRATRIASTSLTALVAVFAFAATAAMAQPAVQGYENDAGRTQAQVQGDDSAPASAAPAAEDASTPVATNAAAADAEGGSLPFTGLDIALLGAAGGLLAGAGLGMRRMMRAPDSPA